MSIPSRLQLFKALKKKNIKAFLFFLLLSVFVWVLIQFAKDYEETISFPVAYTNIPKDKAITSKTEYIQAKIRSTGFKLVGLKVFKPTYTLDVTEAIIRDSSYIYNISENKQNISKALKFNANTTTFQQEEIRLYFNQKVVKKVPIEIITDITYAKGYSNLKPIQIFPDSIKVTGPKAVLDTLTSISTVVVNQKELKQDVNGVIKLNTEGYNNLQFYKAEVGFSIDVGKFTEGKVSVPIEILNVPNTVGISIFPKEVVITYTASLEDFENIKASNFKVAQDYKTLNKETDIFIPKIVKKPETVQQARLVDVQKVQYIIKQ